MPPKKKEKVRWPSSYDRIEHISDLIDAYIEAKDKGEHKAFYEQEAKRHCAEVEGKQREAMLKSWNNFHSKRRGIARGPLNGAKFVKACTEAMGSNATRALRAVEYYPAHFQSQDDKVKLTKALENFPGDKFARLRLNMSKDWWAKGVLQLDAAAKDRLHKMHREGLQKSAAQRKQRKLERKTKQVVPVAPEDRDQYLAGLPAVIADILRYFGEKAGVHCTVIMGAVDQSGKKFIRGLLILPYASSVHYGLTRDGKSFKEHNPSYGQAVSGAYKKFVSECFGPDVLEHIVTDTMVDKFPVDDVEPVEQGKEEVGEEGRDAKDDDDNDEDDDEAVEPGRGVEVFAVGQESLGLGDETGIGQHFGLLPDGNMPLSQLGSEQIQQCGLLGMSDADMQQLSQHSQASFQNPTLPPSQSELTHPFQSYSPRPTSSPESQFYLSPASLEQEPIISQQLSFDGNSHRDQTSFDEEGMGQIYLLDQQLQQQQLLQQQALLQEKYVQQQQYVQHQRYLQQQQHLQQYLQQDQYIPQQQYLQPPTPGAPLQQPLLPLLPTNQQGFQPERQKQQYLQPPAPRAQPLLPLLPTNQQGVEPERQTLLGPALQGTIESQNQGARASNLQHKLPGAVPTEHNSSDSPASPSSQENAPDWTKSPQVEVESPPGATIGKQGSNKKKGDKQAGGVEASAVVTTKAKRKKPDTDPVQAEVLSKRVRKPSEALSITNNGSKDTVLKALRKGAGAVTTK
ncbi:hypothetical protein C8J56DRAFT_895747 [Mycena floridula]|nr:hypothetical protein C8J56DRAFT_895747 [Mycena floridula]